MGTEQQSNYYDTIYKVAGKYSENYRNLPYLSTWALVMQLIYRYGGPCPEVLDIGCGPGQFAEFITSHLPIKYTGIDFSKEAISIANNKTYNRSPDGSLPTFIQADLFKPSIWTKKFTVYTALETLEHIKDDIELISRIPTDAIVIISVPTFDDAGHVRFFKSPNKVLRRYGPYIGAESSIQGKTVEMIRSWFIIYGRRNSMPKPISISL